MNIKAEKLVKYAYENHIRLLIEVCKTGMLYIYTDKKTINEITEYIKQLNITDNIKFKLTDYNYIYKSLPAIIYLDFVKSDKCLRFKSKSKIKNKNNIVYIEKSAKIENSIKKQFQETVKKIKEVDLIKILNCFEWIDGDYTINKQKEKYLLYR